MMCDHVVWCNCAIPCICTGFTGVFEACLNNRQSLRNLQCPHWQGMQQVKLTWNITMFSPGLSGRAAPMSNSNDLQNPPKPRSLTLFSFRGEPWNDDIIISPYVTQSREVLLDQCNDNLHGKSTMTQNFPEGTQSMGGHEFHYRTW